ncbi:peptidyl-prolyl cis-trans isomerase FKBP62-like protein, partial [Trifolium medium]|nr:peptidyl-prolyl cis-trans isomerase FKBP62-like protein [Trifolium medium]
MRLSSLRRVIMMITDQPFEFGIDEGTLNSGIDRAVKNMKKGEIALVIN